MQQSEVASSSERTTIAINDTVSPSQAPYFSGRLDDYSRWLKRLSIWLNSCVFKEAHEITAHILNRLPPSIFDSVSNVIPIEELTKQEEAVAFVNGSRYGFSTKTPKGLVTIITTLQTNGFQPHGTQLKLESMVDFFDYRRSIETPTAEFILLFETKYNRMKSQGVTLDDEVIGILLLHFANLPEESLENVKSAVGKEFTYAGVKDALLRIFKHKRREQPLNHSALLAEVNEQGVTSNEVLVWDEANKVYFTKRIFIRKDHQNSSPSPSNNNGNHNHNNHNNNNHNHNNHNNNNHNNGALNGQNNHNKHKYYCFRCGKNGHTARYCRSSKTGDVFFIEVDAKVWYADNGRNS